MAQARISESSRFRNRATNHGWLPHIMLAMLALTATAFAQTEAPPNVIVIVADTLRSDHLGCYGYLRETSPNLDEFASGATLYERSISAASYTLPAHASIFTGQLPMTHMAQTYLNTDGFKFSEGELVHRPLAPESLTLAEAFSEFGYRTAGFAANIGFLVPRTGLTQGFDEFMNERIHGTNLNEKILPWIEQNQGKPFFLFVNYMDTHQKYNTTKVDGFLEHVSGEGVAAKLFDELYPIIMKEQEPPPDRVKANIDAYDLSIRNLDKAIGEVLAKLRELKLFENTMIIFTSDHGEFLGEHRYLMHWKDVYEEVLRVPLIVKAPHQTESVRVREKISTVSIPRLILDGINHQGIEKHRASFLPVARKDTVVSESRYSHDSDYYDPDWGHRFKRVRTAFYDGSFKFIHSTDGKHELYDLQRDPREEKNIIAAQPKRAEKMQGEIERLIEQSPKPPTVLPDGKQKEDELPSNDEIDALKDLGYL